MSNESNTDELVEAYLLIRSERDKLRNEYELADARLKEDMTKLEAVMLDICN